MDQDNKIPGWMIFLLIYGVANVVLYYSIGIFILPIPGFRR